MIALERCTRLIPTGNLVHVQSFWTLYRLLGRARSGNNLPRQPLKSPLLKECNKEAGHWITYCDITDISLAILRVVTVLTLSGAHFASSLRPHPTTFPTFLERPTLPVCKITGRVSIPMKAPISSSNALIGISRSHSRASTCAHWRLTICWLVSAEVVVCLELLEPHVIL